MRSATVILNERISEKTLASVKCFLEKQSRGRYRIAHAANGVQVDFDHPEDAYEFITRIAAPDRGHPARRVNPGQERLTRTMLHSADRSDRFFAS